MPPLNHVTELMKAQNNHRIGCRKIENKDRSILLGLPWGLSIGNRTKLGWLKACETGEELPLGRTRCIWVGPITGELWLRGLATEGTNSLTCLKLVSETALGMNILDTGKVLLFEINVKMILILLFELFRKHKPVYFCKKALHYLCALF